MKTFFIFLLLFICSASVFSQDVEVTATLDSNRIMIGDQVKFTFDVLFKPDYRIQVPVFADTLASKIEIIEIYRPDTQIIGGKVLFRQQLIITSFDSGLYYIPSIPVLVFYPTGKTDTLFTKPVPLVVQTFKIDTASNKIFDIKPLLGAPLTFREAAPYAISILILAGLIFALVYIYYRRKQNKPILKITKPAEPPHELALRKLDELTSKKLWQQGFVKEFHSEVTDIVREYIENRFKVNALEMTTSEIMAEILKIKEIGNELSGIIEEMLIRADFVKFAKANPLPDENESSLKNAYRFVLETKQVVDLRSSEQPVENLNVV